MKKTDGYIKKTEKVSIIVPVYNVEPYLREALDSVIKQTYENLEILVVDDGSTDGSGAICDEYAAIDERIRVIHQENRGLSGARNTALDIMTGDLVMFLDPDDAYHPEMVKKLVINMKQKNTDVVLCRFSVQRTLKKLHVDCRGRKTKICPSIPVGKYSRIETLKAVAEEKINFSVWNKIYRKQLWVDTRFTEGHVFEDVLTTYQIMNQITKMSIIDEVLYFQRIHPGTITATITEKYIRDRFFAFSMLDRYISETIQGAFNEEQMFHINRYKMEILMDMYSRFYPRGNAERSFDKEVRCRIIDIEKSVELCKCRFRTRVFYQMLYFCPWLLKAIYFGYLLARNNVEMIIDR